MNGTWYTYRKNAWHKVKSSTEAKGRFFVEGEDSTFSVLKNSVFILILSRCYFMKLFVKLFKQFNLGRSNSFCIMGHIH